jgi:uncharacterized membrane protein YeaQ/YmgE (transglycosylase-associated protein family)
MSMIVWILLGFVLGLTASKVVSTTGEGTVVDILLGMVGAVIGGWFFTFWAAAGRLVSTPTRFRAPPSPQSARSLC